MKLGHWKSNAYKKYIRTDVYNFGGSSIVKKTFIYSRSTHDGTQLGLNRHGYRVWWQGLGGMVWEELVPNIFLISIRFPIPKFHNLVITSAMYRGL
jgi:hypothetical protein